MSIFRGSVAAKALAATEAVGAAFAPIPVLATAARGRADLAVSSSTVSMHTDLMPHSEAASVAFSHPVGDEMHSARRKTFVKALLLDVAGTLLTPSEPMTDVYKR